MSMLDAGSRLGCLVIVIEVIVISREFVRRHEDRSVCRSSNWKEVGENMAFWSLKNLSSLPENKAFW